MKEKMMKSKVYKIFGGLLILACVMILLPVKVNAEASAVFRVQTADVQEDGNVDVTVYLTGVSDLGAVDAELKYDSSKVSYVDSQLGKSFKSTYADVYHDDENSLIKYIALYPRAKDAQGAFMKATFRLKEGESYQPELNVVDIVDDSDEIKDISYTITYQQADGTWKDAQDTSGKKADQAVIAEALESYGSDADKKEAAKKSDPVGQSTAGNDAEDSTDEKSASDSNAADDSKTEQQNESETAGVMGNDAGDSQKTLDESADSQEVSNGQNQDGTSAQNGLKSKKAVFAVVGIAAAVIVIILICLAIRKKKKNETGIGLERDHEEDEA